MRASYDSKPYRRMLMELWGATCYPSPSTVTQVGPHWALLGCFAAAVCGPPARKAAPRVVQKPADLHLHCLRLLTFCRPR